MSVDQRLRTALAERADQIEMSVPDLGSVVVGGQRRRWRWQRRVGIAVGCAVVVGAFVAIAPRTAGDPGAALPGVVSSPALWRATEWAAEDVVRHRAAHEELVLARDRNHRAGDLAPSDNLGSLTIWTRCELTSRDPGPCLDPVPVVARSAVEVARRGDPPFTMILPPTPEMANSRLIRSGVRYVGDGRFYLARPTPVLVSADSAAPVALTSANGIVAPHPGVLAVPCSALPPYSMCELDVDERTLTRLDLPPGVQWSPSTTIGFWGVGDRDVFWQTPDGQMKSRTLLTDPSRHLDVPLDVPEGMIVVFESLKDGAIIGDVIHVSEDRGATWRTLVSPVGDHGDGRLPVGWCTWPERRP